MDSSSVDCLRTIPCPFELTERERALFELVEKARLEKGWRCVRVAGGWVRDRLNGGHSEDIDLAVEGISGVRFADQLRDYCLRHAHSVTRVGVVKCNPEQSKHLETGKVKLFDYDLDVTEMRSETYTASRIPRIQSGTACQDALRRDFTLNSLFYNLETQQIEDFTGQGIGDLHAGVLRTPAPPSVTFAEDPLRILRAFRFAASHKFVFDPELAEAVCDPALREGLRTKVSRDRIAIELGAMLRWGRFADSLLSLGEAGLQDVIFPIGSVSWGSAFQNAVNRVRFAEDWALPSFTTPLHLPFVFTTMFTSILDRSYTPFEGAPAPEFAQAAWVNRMLNRAPASNTESDKEWQIRFKELMKTALKMKRTETNTSQDVLNASSLLLGTVFNPNCSLDDAISEFHIPLSQWMKRLGEPLSTASLWLAASRTVDTAESMEGLAAHTKEALCKLKQSPLSQAFHVTPLVNGHDVAASLGAEVLPGFVSLVSPLCSQHHLLIGDCLSVAYAWQLLHPEASHQEVLDYMTGAFAKKDQPPAEEEETAEEPKATEEPSAVKEEQPQEVQPSHYGVRRTQKKHTRCYFSRCTEDAKIGQHDLYITRKQPLKDGRVVKKGYHPDCFFQALRNSRKWPSFPDVECLSGFEELEEEEQGVLKQTHERLVAD